MTGGCHRSPRYQGFGGTATSTTGTLWLLTNISTEEGKETQFPQSLFCIHHFLVIYRSVRLLRRWGRESRGRFRDHRRGITCAAASVKPQRALEAVAMASPNSGRFPFLAFWEMPVMASPST